MRKLKKRLAALGVGLAVMAASAMSLSASALTRVDWPGSAFTPASGSFFATSTCVSVSNLRWSSSQTTAFNPFVTGDNTKYGVEFEFRPIQDPNGLWYGTHDIWEKTTDQISNLPAFYCEFQDADNDDVAVCCGNLSLLSSNETYYGHMFMTKKPSFTIANLPYTFESERNMWVLIASSIINDYLPTHYATYKDGMNNVNFGGTYSW